jgi:hypothetical protein
LRRGTAYGAQGELVVWIRVRTIAICGKMIATFGPKKLLGENLEAGSGLKGARNLQTAVVTRALAATVSFGDFLGT